MLTLVTDAASQVGLLYLGIAGLWLLTEALEARIARRDAARRELLARQRHWR